jgi:NADH-quinone oxidoreductase subunit A
MTSLAAYLLLFMAVGIGFIFVHLMAGKFIRPNKPDPAKRTIYECGEPTIGSAWIQFDLRFYVIALLFVIFDVEVAFFFPWAEVFGKANALAAVGKPTAPVQYAETADRAMELLPAPLRAEQAPQSERLKRVTATDVSRMHELEAKSRSGKLTVEETTELEHLTTVRNLATQTQAQGRQLAWLALFEIAVFFGVLLVGFAYLWRRGDLAWVRSLAAERAGTEPLALSMPAVPALPREPLVGTGSH